MMNKKRGLGSAGGSRLDALLGGIKQVQEVAVTAAHVNTEQGLYHIAVENLQRGVYQPRRDISAESLAELADSINEHGIMQPIVVRLLQNHSDKYEIIAGERRWRAAQLAGLTEVPAIIKPISDEVAIALALIENIQREDLNPMEQATALQRFVDEFGLSHQDIAKTVGKARATVSNLLRLMSLEADVKTLLNNGDIEQGHAKALLALSGLEQVTAARQVASKSLTVRQTENLIKELQKPKAEQSKVTTNEEIERVSQKLAEKLGTEVTITHNAKGRGKIVLQYFNTEQFEGLLSVLERN